MLIDILLDNALQVLGIVEERLDGLQRIFQLIEQFFALLASLGLDTTDTSGNATFRDNLEESDAASRSGVDTTTEFT